jgi:H+-transporting ATPase
MDTADGGEDDALDQWKVENYKEMSPEVSRADIDFSKAGYKTLGVAVKFNDEPWRFVGILPMLDPPRHDTAQTIKNIQAAGIKVKMITGDHLNIAKETARLIGLGQDIHAGAETREAGDRKNQLIWEADGFAQVLPKDKREVVIVLREHFKIVVGMTGDGVNDAPALSAAQCGIAVDDATDAAKNAAAIILTSPGLSAIYSAVVESRRIFRKLKSYVTYRIAASVQIVVVLTLLIYISNCPITSLYIVILALFNDLTMLPIAYDAQNASAAPENPDVKKILIMSMIFGAMEAGFTLLFAYVATETRFFAGDMDIRGCSIPSQAGTWLQMSIASEFLIFSARAPSFIVTSIAPSITLFSSVMAGCLFLSLLTGVIPYFGYLSINDIVLIWGYNIITLFFIDCVKVAYLQYIGDSLDVLPEQVFFISFDSASLLFIGHLLLIINDTFCTYAFLAGLYGSIRCRFFNTLVCNLYK